MNDLIGCGNPRVYGLPKSTVYECRCSLCLWQGTSTEWEEHLCARCEIDVCHEEHVCADQERDE